jgi:Fe-only nitrogenase accessory protein AnfO
VVKIGVVLNQEEQIASLLEGGKVAIYERKESTWIKTDEVKQCFSQRDSINQMREFLDHLVKELKDCKILVASIITGIPFMLLDKEGFMLCEAEEMSKQLLEEIAYDYEKMKQEKERLSKDPLKDYPTAPFETKEKGVFELDMRKLQKCHPEISSKKALFPFLKEMKFSKLMIYCSHVMPWLDRELKGFGYCYQVNKLEEQGYQVDIKSIVDQ